MKTEYKFSRMQIDLTDKCNSACLFCPRTTNPEKVSNVDLTVEDIKKLMKSDVKRVWMCGNYGDASMNTHLFDIIEYLKTTQCEEIRIATNGSAHSPDWWARLAKSLRPCDQVVFAIDGNTAESHESYRKQTSFDQILKNTQSFIDAGGWAIWQFILFDYNKDELESAKERAQKMGFSNFRIIYSARNLQYGTGTHKIGKKFYTKIDPICIKRDRFYVSAKGEVSPCCWAAETHQSNGVDMPKLEDFDSLKDLLESDTWNNYFQGFIDHWNEIENTKSIKTTSDGSKYPCTKKCGMNSRNVKETINFCEDRIFIEDPGDGENTMNLIV